MLFRDNFARVTVFRSLLRMRNLFTLLLVLSSVVAFSQDKPKNKTTPAMKYNDTMNHYHKVTASISVGFIDQYKRNYSLPAGFEKSNTSGFAPFYAKLEYGLGKRVTIAGTFSYDAFVYNFNQLYESSNGIIRRYKTDNFRLASGGISGFYHFNKLAFAPRFRPFGGVGFSLNNIRHSAFPQGDSIVVRKEHALSPYLKVGGRYFISDKFSIYVDAGYDHQSIFSIGFSSFIYKDNKKEGVKQ